MQIADPADAAPRIVAEMQEGLRVLDSAKPRELTVYVPIAAAVRAAKVGIDVRDFYWQMYGAKTEFI